MDQSGQVRYVFQGIDFEWHLLKAEVNWVKHGIKFEDAAVAFVDEFARLIDDPKHSEDEPRFLHFGMTAEHGLLVVVYVERGSAVRIISARAATRTERRVYDREAGVGV